MPNPKISDAQRLALVLEFLSLKPYLTNREIARRLATPYQTLYRWHYEFHDPMYSRVVHRRKKR